MKRNRRGGYAVGIDLGGTTVTAALVSRDGEMLSRTQLPSEAKAGMDITCRQIALAAETVIREAGKKEDDIIACGMGTPGVFTAETGDMHFVPNFKEWDGKNLYEALEKHSPFMYYIGNDVNVAAVGEYAFGAGRGSTAMVMFTMGTGIGSGVIIRGRAQFGLYSSPELGHMIIRDGGSLCACGARGCLESFCGKDAITNRCADKLLSGRKSGIRDEIGDNLSLITPKLISKYAKAGDEVCAEVMDETGYYMGLGVANAINIFNPDKLVIGGGVGSSQLIFAKLKETALSTALPTLAAQCDIVQSELGEYAGVRGAAELAFKGEYA